MAPMFSFQSNNKGLDFLSLTSTMAMNYVGSISILDRGDAPAQAVIDRNARSLAQRIADETKDELEKVMTRVETVSEGPVVLGVCVCVCVFV